MIDVLKRTDDSGGVATNRRKLFEDNQHMVFEQDFAACHSTNANQEFMSQHFPNHTPTLWRLEQDEFFLSKCDGFCAILAGMVYRHSSPKTITTVLM